MIYCFQITRSWQVNKLSNPFEKLGVTSQCTPEELHKAYRSLARRWHPDRFLAGPEREWANQHMTEINAAYAECQAMLKKHAVSKNGSIDLDSVHAMIMGNRFSEARRALLKSDTRCARWNYLFGIVLQKQGEVVKALTYFNLAVRQAPDNDQYLRARNAVQRLVARNKVAGLFHSLHGKRR